MFSSFKGPISKNNIAVLDGVRAFACLIVIAFHIDLKTLSMGVWHPLSGIGWLVSAMAVTGYIGVTLFFVLSGILLFMPYAGTLLFEKPWPTLKQFYLRRILRIWPGYYISLALLILVVAPEYLQPVHLKDLGLFLTFFMDSTPETFQKVNGPFWTLAVEWQYYMLLPFVALGFRWIIGRIGGDSLHRRWWTLISCLGGLFAWGIFSRYWGGYFVEHADQTFLVPRPVLNVFIFFLYGSNGKYMEDFAIGMLIAGCLVLSQQVPVQHRLRMLGEGIRRCSLWIWGGGVLVLLFMTMWNGNQWFRHSLPVLDPLYGPYAWLSESGFALGFGLCVLALLFGPASLKLPFEWGPIRWIGLISYSLYIWHQPMIFDFAEHIKPLVHGWSGPLVFGLFWACVLLIVIPFSYGFFRLVERPWMQLADRLRYKQMEALQHLSQKKETGSVERELVGSREGSG